MKVQELLNELKQLDPNDEVVSLLWTYDLLRGYMDNENRLLMKSEWQEVVSNFQVGANDLPVGNALRKALEQKQNETSIELDDFVTRAIDEMELQHQENKLWEA